MDNDNKIARLHAANASHGERMGFPSYDTDTNELNSEIHDLITDESDDLEEEDNSPLVAKTLSRKKPISSIAHDESQAIHLSKNWDLVKSKRSQGMNQVSNSIKLYDKRSKQYITIAASAGIVIDDKNPMSPAAHMHHKRQIDVVQILFDGFLKSIHEKL